MCPGRGSGSFGKIYYAINSQNGQEVAVKTEEQSGAYADMNYALNDRRITLCKSIYVPSCFPVQAVMPVWLH